MAKQKRILTKRKDNDAHHPNPQFHYVIGFSGGKDSVATWLHLTRELHLPKVTCTFADTGHEWAGLDEYLTLLETNFNLPLVRIQPTLEDIRGALKPEKIAKRLGLDCTDEKFWQQPLNMQRLAILKRRFPSATARFCTTHLKLFPQNRWMRKHCDLNETIRVAGVRSQESANRARRPAFSYDEFMKCPLWLPIKSWTHEQVFELHAKYDIPVNPLYKQGCGRVGCFPCIMARKQELAAIANYHPEAFDELRSMERQVATAVGKQEMSFFSHGKTPPRYESHVCPSSGKGFPDANDVRLWALNEEPANSTQLPLFEEDWTEDVYRCTSQYGLCE